MAAYRDNAEKVCGAVIFQKRNQDTFGRDLEEMIAAKMTFQEAICAAKLPIMAKQRLKLIERDLFDQLARIPFYVPPRWRPSISRNWQRQSPLSTVSASIPTIRSWR